MHDRGRKKNNITCMDRIGNAFYQVTGTWSKQNHDFIKAVEMLEFHINRSIPSVIINVIKCIILRVIDNNIMFVFIKNIVIDQHGFSIG